MNNEQDRSELPLAVESVWDYPRPPRLEPVPQRIRILHQQSVVADTTAALRILETSHPPVYYLPAACFGGDVLRRSRTRGSFCEFKGMATYCDLVLSQSDLIEAAGWTYESPERAYSAMAGHVALYASRLGKHGIECWVGNEVVRPQEGDFYGGWITSNLRGPFKGAPGTRGW